MGQIQYNKLVRDRIPEMIEAAEKIGIFEKIQQNQSVIMAKLDFKTLAT